MVAGAILAAVAGVNLVKHAAKCVKNAGGIKNAVKNLWTGIKTSAKEAWNTVRENPETIGYFIAGGLFTTAMRVGVNVMAPGFGRIAGSAAEVGMGLFSEFGLSRKKKVLAEKLVGLRSLTEGFSDIDVEIPGAAGAASTTVREKPGTLYREYIEQKARLRLKLNEGSITIKDADGNDIDKADAWEYLNNEDNEDESTSNEQKIFDLVKANFASANNHDKAREVVIQQVIDKSK